MASIDVASGEYLIPRIRHEMTRSLAQALLAKFPAARMGLMNYNWTCGFALAKVVDDVQYRQAWYLCGEHADGTPFSFGMPDYDRLVGEIETWLAS